jgi:predicted membrane protein
MARALSLLLAAALAAALMLLPAMRARELTAAGHGLLTPLLLVVCALFVHGLGYQPQQRWAARLLTPWLLWPLAIALAMAWWLRS